MHKHNTVIAELSSLSAQTKLIPTGCVNRHFIVSGEGIEIRPLASTGLPDDYPSGGRFPTLLEVEQEYVQRVLAYVAGNKSRAAQVLGIDRVSLWRKLKKLENLAPSIATPLQGYSDHP